MKLIWCLISDLSSPSMHEHTKNNFGSQNSLTGSMVKYWHPCAWPSHLQTPQVSLGAHQPFKVPHSAPGERKNIHIHPLTTCTVSMNCPGLGYPLSPAGARPAPHKLLLIAGAHLQDHRSIICCNPATRLNS